jgi:branched-chain amino acid transport system substrate-binding protein
MPSTTVTSGPSPAAPLIVGIIVPFTESAINSDFGVEQQRAAELYLQQHGGKLGGRDAKLVYSDESITGSIDTVKATQLVENEHAEVLLGLIGTDGAYAVRNYADTHHVVFIDTHAPGDALTRAVPGCTPSCLSPYLFRSSFSAWQLAEPLGAWAAGKGIKAFDVVSSDDTFGTESAAAFVGGLGTAGGTATTRSTVKPGADWTKVTAAIGAQQTKNIFAAFEGADAASFIAAWDHAGLTARGFALYGPGPLTGVDVLAQVKAAAAGATTASFWSSSLDNPENKALENLFSTTYKDESGNPVNAGTYVIEMWDAMTALDKALGQTSGSASADALIPALEGVSFSSPRGGFAFDAATHNVVQDIYIRQVQVTGSDAGNAIIDTIPKVADPGR